EASDTRRIDVVSLTQLDIRSGTQGASGLVVRISASSNSQFRADSRPTFGPGVTVRSATVESPSSLLATIDISATAVPGPRDVGVISAAQHAVLRSGFEVTRPTTEPVPPVITATVVPPPNANGWHRTNVVITFACINATSCPSPLTVTTEGVNQTYTGTA